MSLNVLSDLSHNMYDKQADRDSKWKSAGKGMKKHQQEQ